MFMRKKIETQLWKNQMSRINGIPNIVLPNTLFNRIAWDETFNDLMLYKVYHKPRLWKWIFSRP